MLTQQCPLFNTFITHFRCQWKDSCQQEWQSKQLQPNRQDNENMSQNMQQQKKMEWRKPFMRFRHYLRYLPPSRKTNTLTHKNSLKYRLDRRERDWTGCVNAGACEMSHVIIADVIIIIIADLAVEIAERTKPVDECSRRWSWRRVSSHTAHKRRPLLTTGQTSGTNN